MSRLPIPPDHRPWAELWKAWASDPEGATESLGSFLNEMMEELNRWVLAKPRTPEEMVKGMRIMNGAWLRYCKDTEGYGPTLPSRPGHVASPAEWTWMSIMAQQGPFTRGLIKLCHVRPEVLKFLTDPENYPMPAQYGKVADHRIVYIEQGQLKKRTPHTRIRHGARTTGAVVNRFYRGTFQQVKY